MSVRGITANEILRMGIVDTCARMCAYLFDASHRVCEVFCGSTAIRMFNVCMSTRPAGAGLAIPEWTNLGRTEVRIVWIVIEYFTNSNRLGILRNSWKLAMSKVANCGDI